MVYVVDWCNTSNNVLKELKIFQNQIFKVIVNKTLRSKTKILYKDLKLLPIKNLYYKTIVIFQKKNITSLILYLMTSIPVMLKKFKKNVL